MGQTLRPERATPPLLKSLNERSVLEAIRAGSPISRAEISRRVGISKPTVSLALRSLVDAGLVREAAEGPGGPRYGAVFFEPVDDAALVLGLDLGARFLRGAVCDLVGDVIRREDVELERADADAALDAIADLVTSLVRASGRDLATFERLVVGVPGVVDGGSGEVRLANLSGLEGRPFAAEVSERVGLTATVENDVNLAALGEHWQGIARGVQDFAFLSIGTGMGAGLVLGGELHRGYRGAAGEVDFAAAALRADVDPSAEGVAVLAARLAADGATTVLAPPYEARAVFGAARGGDGVARAVVAEIARRIAVHVAPIAAVADVELVVLGGGLGANGDLLLGTVRAHLREWMPYAPRVEVSGLGEAAVLAGALSVGVASALDSVFVNRPRAT